VGRLDWKFLFFWRQELGKGWQIGLLDYQIFLGTFYQGLGKVGLGKNWPILKIISNYWFNLGPWGKTRLNKERGLG